MTPGILTLILGLWVVHSKMEAHPESHHDDKYHQANSQTAYKPRILSMHDR